LTTTASVSYNAHMNGYLVFALVTTLQLVGVGISHYTIDVIQDGSLQSQYAVATDGSLSRFVRSGDQSSGYMEVERAASFGQVYTVLPGAAMNADAKAAAQKPSSSGSAGGGAQSAQAIAQAPVATQPQASAQGAPTSAQLPAATPAILPPLPPIAFSLADVMNGIGPLESTQQLQLTVNDPVQDILGALSSANRAKVTSAPTPAGEQTAPGGVVAGAAPSAPKMLTLSFSRRGEVTYLELPQQKLLLAVHVSP